MFILFILTQNLGKGKGVGVMGEGKQSLIITMAYCAHFYTVRELNYVKMENN